MGLPRSKYVKEEEEGVYHCFSRCVRRAFLYGHDSVTGRDFSHRKAWLVDRLRLLSTVFAIQVCAYAIMDNHYHLVLRILPAIVGLWTDREVAVRWLTLFPCRNHANGGSEPPSENEIQALTNCPERIAELRRRLCSLGWFMGRLNEYMARRANKEDNVTGRFWEGRFKSQALLDEAAIATCMVYVDLNLIRAGLADSPEESDFTSIQERIRTWRKENVIPESSPDLAVESLEGAASIDCWLCPVQSDSRCRGILQMTTLDYFNLVDKSGRMIRSDKGGVIDPDLAPILLRIGANPQAWLDITSHFGSKFHLAAGLLPNLRAFADRLGKKWLTGVATARAAFFGWPQPA